MSKPSDSKAPAREGKSQKAAGVDRRRLFLMGGSAVKNYYRVNRY